MNVPLLQHAVSDGVSVAISFTWFQDIQKVLGRFGGKFVRDKSNIWYTYWVFSRKKITGTWAERLHAALSEPAIAYDLAESYKQFYGTLQHALDHPQKGILDDLPGAIPMLPKSRPAPPDPSKYSEEQIAAVLHENDMCLESTAGSGKTYTLVGYARQRPDKRILYLVYNASARKDAEPKFRGLPHVHIETAHSLAYRAMQVGRKFKLSESGNLSLNDVVAFLKIKKLPHSEHLITAKNILTHFNAYLNSDYNSPYSMPLPLDLDQEKKLTIIAGITQLFDDMSNARIPITHDAYLKMYQLTQPQLPYDVILLDEGQDSNPAILDIFIRQKATKVIVGDSYQQIYRFRGAVNSLEKVGFPRLYLSASYRFGQDIADLGMQVLKLRTSFGYPAPTINIRGLGDPGKASSSIGILSRTNTGLLQAAIIETENPAAKIHFEGGIQNYAFMGAGSLLHDVYRLWSNRRLEIKNDMIGQFTDFWHLKEFAAITDDREIGMLCSIVERYKRALYPLLNRIREKHVDRKDAQIIFSTTHKSKGLQYGSVKLLPGFATAASLLKLQEKASTTGRMLDYDDLAEEVNNHYTALTRTESTVNYITYET